MKPVAVFQLELEHAPLLNRFMFMHWTKRAQLKRQIAVRLLAQIGRRKDPLAGRPRLLATRYSTQKPDQDGAWTKLWLDVLKCGTNGLGWIRDDSDEHIELVTRWEKAKRGEGRVVVHIFDGPDANEGFEKEQGWL